MGDLRTLDEVCERYRVCSETIRRWIKTGLLPQPIKLGKQRLFRVTDLLAFENTRSSAA